MNNKDLLNLIDITVSFEGFLALNKLNLNLKKIKNSFVSDESIKIVKKFLEKEEQVLFFLNRRGYAPYLICKN